MLEEKNIEVKFGKVVEEWLITKKTQVKESVYCNYKQKIKYYLKDCFYDKPITYFKSYDFTDFILDLCGKLSNKTVKDVLSLLKQILKYIEIKYDMNLKISLIKSPAIYQKEIEVFTEREKNRILKYCVQSKDVKEMGVLIALYSGARIGEVCGLKWGDINLDDKCIYIRRTAQRIYEFENGTKVVITTPKTVRSVRTIPLADALYEKLRPISKKYSKDTYILSGIEEKGIEPQAYRNVYRKILKNSRVNMKKFHTLRHTFATNCIKVGMDPKSLSEVLGHSNVNITLNLYVHPSFETKKKFINKL